VKEKAVWRLVPEQQYETSGLLRIQLAAAKLAAARGDMVAVLGLPKHYRLPEIGPYQQQLLAGLQLAGDTTASYVALYHPWLVSREDTGDLIHTHPAGGVCGAIAARSLARGAWVAPANQVLSGILATVPNFRPEDEFALYSCGINPIQPGARGVVIWGEHTQSADSELENLNVRRLLILLRRMSLTEGQTYVFAPNSPAFRRRIQQQFEQVLGRLYSLGAFVGSSPSEAYRVVIDETVNPSARVEQGQLIVELQVAPSQPLTFITVRLVQLEGGGLTLQEGQNYGR
jgi:phage tail sheath protein FI